MVMNLMYNIQHVMKVCATIIIYTCTTYMYTCHTFNMLSIKYHKYCVVTLHNYVGIQDVILPPKLKKCGRLKGAEKTVIGLPAKKRKA